MISFGSLATFLEKALASKDSAMRRLDVSGKVLLCAKEESRRKMAALIEVPGVASCSANSSSLEMPKTSEAQMAMPGQFYDVQQAVRMLSHVLVRPCFDPRESLGALMALKHLLDTDPGTVSALSKVSGVQRALCNYSRRTCFGIKDMLPNGPDSRRR